MSFLKDSQNESTANNETVTRLPDRIVFVCHKIDGGIGRNILRLCRDFNARRIKLEIWSAVDQSAFPNELPKEVKFRHLKTTHAISGVFFVLGMLQSFKPTIVITPSERFTRIIYRAVKFIKNKPLIVACVHNYYSLFYGQLPLNKQTKRKRLINKIYPKIDAVLSVSQGAMQDFIKYGGFKKSSSLNIQTIYNPIFDDSVKMDSGTKLPESLDLTAPVVVNVGNIVEQKNHKFLIQSFLKLRELRKCSLVIVGDGDRSELTDIVNKSKFKEDIFFVGHQTDPYTFISIAKVFAFTSLYEGFGNVVVESLLFGTPVVSTDSGGPREILCDPDFGEIIDTNDPKVFAGGLSRWLDKSVDKQKLIDHAQQNYSVAAIADQYINLFSSLLNNRKKYHPLP